jgi:hypothetical protein
MRCQIGIDQGLSLSSKRSKAEFQRLNAPNKQSLGPTEQSFGPNQQLITPNHMLTGSFKLLNAPNQHLICPPQWRLTAFRHRVGLIRLTVAARKGHQERVRSRFLTGQHRLS